MKKILGSRKIVLLPLIAIIIVGILLFSSVVNPLNQGDGRVISNDGVNNALQVQNSVQSEFSYVNHTLVLYNGNIFRAIIGGIYITVC